VHRGDHIPKFRCRARLEPTAACTPLSLTTQTANSIHLLHPCTQPCVGRCVFQRTKHASGDDKGALNVCDIVHATTLRHASHELSPRSQPWTASSPLAIVCIIITTTLPRPGLRGFTSAGGPSQPASLTLPHYPCFRSRLIIWMLKTTIIPEPAEGDALSGTRRATPRRSRSGGRCVGRLAPASGHLELPLTSYLEDASASCTRSSATPQVPWQ